MGQDIALATGVQVVLSLWYFGGQQAGCSSEMGGWAAWRWQAHWPTKWGRVWEISIPIKQCTPARVHVQHSHSQFMNTSPCGWDFLQLSVLSDFTWSLHFLCWTLTSYAKLLCHVLNSHILHWFYSRLQIFIQNSHLPMVSMTYCELTFILAKRPGQILAYTIFQPKLMWLASSVKNKFN